MTNFFNATATDNIKIIVVVFHFTKLMYDWSIAFFFDGGGEPENFTLTLQTPLSFIFWQATIHMLCERLDNAVFLLLLLFFFFFYIRNATYTRSSTDPDPIPHSAAQCKMTSSVCSLLVNQLIQHNKKMQLKCRISLLNNFSDKLLKTLITPICRYDTSVTRKKPNTIESGTQVK